MNARVAKVCLFGLLLPILPNAALAQIEHVIVISVDGLRPDAITALGPAAAPNFYRFRNEGAFTQNARTDFDYTITLPNHTSMLTSRRVTMPEGHGWTTNTDPAPGVTLHSNKGLGAYIASGFDVAHDNGLRTALYAGKSKFSLYPTSYSSTNGALDVTGDDNGRQKIDVSLINDDTAVLTAAFVAGIQAQPFNFSMLHLREPDDAGHSSTWDVINPNSAYMNSVRDVDSFLGTVLNSIESDPDLDGHTAIILTADHGGVQGTNGHGTATNAQNYTIPFYVWGPGVAAGADLYAMNTAIRLNPGVTRPAYTAAVQPIRSGEAANLALDLLGLGPVPGSTINTSQNLTVLNPYPPGDYNYDGNVDDLDFETWKQQAGTQAKRSADGNDDGAVDAADYVVWRKHDGIGAGSTASGQDSVVPEPGTPFFAIVAVALLSSLCGNRPRNFNLQ
jgi:hypothetical protein